MELISIRLPLDWDGKDALAFCPEGGRWKVKPDAGWGLLLGAGEGRESVQAEERPGSEAGQAEERSGRESGQRPE